MSDNEVRLIDANALIEDLKSLKYIGYCNDSFSILCNREIERCISAVEDAPTADDWENYSTKLWKEAYEQGKADRPQGMSDLISREELKKHKFLTPDYIQLGGRRNGKTIERINLAYQKGWNDAIDAIVDNAPTVKQPTGEWEFREFDEATGISRSRFCSNCGIPVSQVYRNYCGNCGAKMKGGEGDDE